MITVRKWGYNVDSTMEVTFAQTCADLIKGLSEETT